MMVHGPVVHIFSQNNNVTNFLLNGPYFCLEILAQPPIFIPTHDLSPSSFFLKL